MELVKFQVLPRLGAAKLARTTRQPFSFLCLVFIHFWLHWVLVAARGILAGTYGLFVALLKLLSSHGGSEAAAPPVVVAHRSIVASRHGGILVLRPGIQPTSPALEGGFLTTGPPGQHIFPWRN